MPMCLLLKWFHIYAFKSGESEAAQSCPTLGNPMDSNLLGSSPARLLCPRQEGRLKRRNQEFGDRWNLQSSLDISQNPQGKSLKGDKNDVKLSDI